MYSDFQVQNFRTFDELSVKLQPVTLISGRNNTGKTALLEAVFLHACGPLAGAAALLTLQNARSQGPIVLNAEEKGTVWDSLYHDYGVSRTLRLDGIYNHQNITVEIAAVEGSGRFAIGTASSDDSGQSFTQSVQVIVRRAGTKKTYVQTASQQPFVSAGLANVQLGGINLQLKPASEPILQARYLAGRTRASQVELASRYSSLRVDGKDEDLIAAIREIEPRLRDLEVLVRNGQPVLHADIGRRNLIPLPLFGEGMVAVVDFISAIYESRGSLVLIDEIENGIHYTVLERIWRQIDRAARQADTQVIATTHSRECLESAMTAFSDDARLGLLRLWRSPQNMDRVSVASYDEAELRTALAHNLDVR